MFFWRKARGTPPLAGNIDSRMPESEPATPVGDEYADFRECEAELKAWVPAPLWNGFAALAELTGVSRAILAREELFALVYGRLDLERMRAGRDGLFYTGEPKLFFSRSRNVTPELGKSDKELRLLLPAKLLHDLQSLADARSEPLSSFVRRALTTLVFGQHYLPDPGPVVPR